jgi:hypothetical protein
MSQLVKTKRQLILKILSDLKPLRGSSNKKTLYSTRSCVNWAFLALVAALGGGVAALRGPGQKAGSEMARKVREGRRHGK